MEIHAREHIQLAAPGHHVFMRVPMDNKDETGKAVFAREGYLPVRYHWRMEMNSMAHSRQSLRSGLS